MPVLRGDKPSTETAALMAGVSIKRAHRWLKRLRDAGWCAHRLGAWRLTSEGMSAVNAWVFSVKGPDSRFCHRPDL